jgi:8-oxo-dGTP diphosphatase
VSVGAVILDRGRVLLVKRARAPLQGEWSLPGGVVELGETLRQAVVREVLEETGLVVEVGPVVEVLERVQESTDGRVEYHYVIIDYLCRARPGEPAHGSDAAAVQWAATSDLAGYRLAPITTAVVHKALELATQNP